MVPGPDFVLEVWSWAKGKGALPYSESPCFLVGAPAETHGLYLANYDSWRKVPGGVRGDSGVDLFLPDRVTISGAHTEMVDSRTYVRCLYRGRFVGFFQVPRSSIWKTSLILHNSPGTIDAHYTGTIRALLRDLNEADQYTVIQPRTALTQLVHPSLEPPLVVLLPQDHAAFTMDTARGAGGFGSTGNTGGASAAVPHTNT